MTFGRYQSFLSVYTLFEFLSEISSIFFSQTPESRLIALSYNEQLKIFIKQASCTCK